MVLRWFISMNSSIKTLFNLTDYVEGMKKVPDTLYYLGNADLLHKPKLSIVGTRRPTAYTKSHTYSMAQKLSQCGICVVSGGAMGVDALAHQGAGTHNTIMVAGTGLDQRYPSINHTLIQQIEENGLVLSQFKRGEPSLKWNFPLRNELIVALGSALIVTQADIKSGTMHSVEFALKMKKKIYVLPHRLGESEGTQMLLAKGLAEAVYDIESLIETYGDKKTACDDPFLRYCDTAPLYTEAVNLYAQTVFEYECLGKIVIEHGRIKRL